MADIVVSEFMDEAALRVIPPRWRVRYGPDLVDERERLIEALADARALIVRNRTKVDSELIDAAPGLSAVGRLGVGLDNIDLDACAARDIAVLPATGANTRSVAEYVMSAALSLVRGAYAANEAMVAGKWPRSRLIGGEIAGRLLGLVGYGAIARAVAERARAFGMRIAAHDPYLSDDDPVWTDAERLDWDTLIASVDVLSLHVPLTTETRNLIDGAAIARMKSDAVLINTARGGIVDEAALAAALRVGHLGGAALDVFETEPLPRTEAYRFDGIANLILTPHIAGVTEEANIRVSRMTVENVLKILESRS
ncbi:MAG: hydroxyacid dehydrogenase [Pseudomonadota bacterium]